MKISQHMNINRIEFVIASSCTGRCRHCSVGNDINKPGAAACFGAEEAAKSVNGYAEWINVNTLFIRGQPRFVRLSSR